MFGTHLSNRKQANSASLFVTFSARKPARAKPRFTRSGTSLIRLLFHLIRALFPSLRCYAHICNFLSIYSSINFGGWTTVIFERLLTSEAHMPCRLSHSHYITHHICSSSFILYLNPICCHWCNSSPPRVHILWTQVNLRTMLFIFKLTHLLQRHY